MTEKEQLNVERLLTRVGATVEESNKIARLKGENFNIFSILDLERRENKTHSNFLVSLLNPKGEHGLGDIFLQLFYNIILSNDNGIALSDEKRKIIEVLKPEKVSVITEKSLGRINYDELEGGRVDISIASNDGKIFIENKIDARDQRLQIARYAKDQKAVVFYLTLNGDEPSKDSSGNFILKKDFFLLSYRTDITTWLEKCQKETSDFPIIRETIKQYLILIKKLTGQLTINEMTEKIYESILNNIEAAKVISQNIDAAKESVRIEYRNVLADKIIDITGQDYEITRSSNKGFLHISIRKDTWHKDLKYLIEINPNGISYLTLVLEDKQYKDPSFFEQAKKILGNAYFDKWACISELIEICVLNDQFIGEYYSKKEEEKDISINESADKILKYIQSYKHEVDRISEIL